MENKNLSSFLKSVQGIERETFRVIQTGEFSRQKHFSNFGSSLTHKFIKTDFSEPQLEFVTSPADNINSCLDFLRELHLFCQYKMNLENELFWPFSMPPSLPQDELEIPLAFYGNSHSGKWKTVYRNGLGLRYGRRMQTISGVHFNFSFSSEFIQIFMKEIGLPSISDFYLNIIRNFLPLVPFMLYLSGASSIVDRSFFGNHSFDKFLKHKKNTFISKNGTSLRMSDIGYTSSVQELLNISYNSLDDYIQQLCLGISTPHQPYEKYSSNKDAQLNSNLLQIENEFYSSIRPKRITKNEERPIDALKNRGIEYIELRFLDIDPFSEIGVNQNIILFLHIILVYCATRKSSLLSQLELSNIRNVIKTVSWEGRDKNLKLEWCGYKHNFHEEGKKFTELLAPIAEKLDSIHSLSGNPSTIYSKTLQEQILKWENVGNTDSERMIDYLIKNNMEYIDYGLELASKNRDKLKAFKSDILIQKKLNEEAIQSLEQLANLEKEEKVKGSITPKVCIF